MSYTRTTTINSAPGGDSVKQAILDLDTDLTGAFTGLNAHEELTATHGATGAVVGTTNAQTLTNKTLTAPKLNEAVALTATSTELNRSVGVTSDIQGQLNAKAPNVLTGYVSGAGTVAATDTVLQAVQKLDGNVAGKMPLAGTAGAVSFGAVNILPAGSIVQTALFIGEPTFGTAYGLALQVDGNSGVYGLFPVANSVMSASPAIAVNRVSGNVIVGTTTDDGVNKLQVNGGASFAGGISASGGIKFNGSVGAIDLTDQYDIRLAAANNSLLQIQMRGTDGVTRVANISLA